MKHLFFRSPLQISVKTYGFLIFIAQSVFAIENPDFNKLQPPNFQFESGKAIFVDFKRAHYKLDFHAERKEALAQTKIDFESKEFGMPLFDLKDNPIAVYIDGRIVRTKVVPSPDNKTSLVIALKNITQGQHTMAIISSIKENVLFDESGVSAAFWFSDLIDRSFLETYLPANLEYDQYQMTFEIDFHGPQNQILYTNGDLTQISSNHFLIKFPEYFNSSSLYFHTTPKNKLNELNFNFTMGDGKSLPITLYASQKWSKHYNDDTNKRLNSIKNKIISHLKYLEDNFGLFPHSKLLVYLTQPSGGGMEYAGATITSEDALTHEITHSYFGRGYLMPPNGNSGWLDEAITTWITEGAITVPDIDTIHVNLANVSPYLRTTPIGSYYHGRDFIGHLHYKLQVNGGIFDFLKSLKSSQFSLTSTENFIEKLSQFYNYEFKPLFLEHIYNSKNIENEITSKGDEPQMHMKYSIEELYQFL